jgi:hypothetical protein
LDKLEAQEEKEKKERKKKEATSTTIQLVPTTAKQPSNLPSLSSEELLVFEFSF